MKQLPNQTTFQFITSVQTATMLLKWDVAQTIRVVIGRLHPAIRTFLIQEPATMAALIEAATLAENSTSRSSMTTTLMKSNALAEMRYTNSPGSCNVIGSCHCVGQQQQVVVVVEGAAPCQ